MCNLRHQQKSHDSTPSSVNAWAERFSRTLHNRLRILSNAPKNQSPEHLPELVCTPHLSTTCHNICCLGERLRCHWIICLVLPSSVKMTEYVAIYAFRIATRCNEKEGLKRKTRSDKSTNATDPRIECRDVGRNFRIRDEERCRPVGRQSRTNWRINQIMKGMCMPIHLCMRRVR